MSSDYGYCPPHKLADLEKDPDSAQTIEVNWARELDGETISTSSWEGDGLTLASQSTSGSTATALASGGVHGSRYEVKNTVTTSGGQTFAKRLVVSVREL